MLASRYLLRVVASYGGLLLKWISNENQILKKQWKIFWDEKAKKITSKLILNRPKTAGIDKKAKENL